MVDAIEEIHITQPPGRVWDALAAFDGISRWAPNVEHSSPSNVSTEGVGAVRRVQVGRNALLERVTEWEPGRRLTYSIEGLPPVVRSATNSWELAESRGGTHVVLTSVVDAGSRPPQRVIARVIGKAMAKSSRQMLTGLREHLQNELEEQSS